MPEAEARARPPIDPEELAAFIDGRLEGDRRRAMIERLADDEDAYELYDETIRVREELAAVEADPARPAVPVEAAGRPAAAGSGRTGAVAAPVVPLAGRTRAPRANWGSSGWLAAAAALALAVLVGWIALRARQPAGSSEMLARFDPAFIGTRALELAGEPLGRVVRSGEQLPPEEREARFRLGVRSFSLALAAQAGDEEKALAWLDEIDHLLDEILEGFASEPTYRELRLDLESGATPPSLRQRITAAEAELARDLDLPEEPYFAFGRWVEAVRVAAATGDRRFLDGRTVRRPLDDFLAVPPSPVIADHLATVVRELDRGSDAADLAAVAEALGKIREECGKGTICFGVPEPPSPQIPAADAPAGASPDEPGAAPP